MYGQNSTPQISQVGFPFAYTSMKNGDRPTFRRQKKITLSNGGPFSMRRFSHSEELTRPETSLGNRRSKALIYPPCVVNELAVGMAFTIECSLSFWCVPEFAQVQ